MDLSTLADQYHAARESGGLVLEPDEVLECAVRAARYYAGYGTIESLAQFPAASLAARINEATVLTVGELAVVVPLFNLYAELENAMRLEASRAAGMDPYGRTVSEIRADITNMELVELPQRSFCADILTIGGEV